MFSSQSFCSVATRAFEVLPKWCGVGGMTGGIGWVSEVVVCFGVEVCFFGVFSLDRVPAVGGTTLIGFFADFGGSLK